MFRHSAVAGAYFASRRASRVYWLSVSPGPPNSGGSVRFRYPASLNSVKSSWQKRFSLSYPAARSLQRSRSASESTVPDVTVMWTSFRRRLGGANHTALLVGLGVRCGNPSDGRRDGSVRRPRARKNEELIETHDDRRIPRAAQRREARCPAEAAQGHPRRRTWRRGVHLLWDAGVPPQ